MTRFVLSVFTILGTLALVEYVASEAINRGHWLSGCAGAVGIIVVGTSVLCRLIGDY